MAISVGISIQSGTLLQKCGSYWCRYGSSQIVNSLLSNGTTASVIAIGSSNTTTNCSSAWAQNTQTAGMSNLGSGDCNLATNGQWYDSCQGGIRDWFNAINYCVSKGMRLSALNETQYSNGYGRPHVVAGGGEWLIDDANNGSYDDKLVWNSSIYGNPTGASNYTCCVK